MPDERQGEAGKAFVVPAADAEVDEVSVIAWRRDDTASYEVPRSVQIVDELPLNATGKVSKLELCECAKALRG